MKKRDILDDIKMSSLIHVVERNSKPPAIYKVIKKGENKSSDDSGSRWNRYLSFKLYKLNMQKSWYFKFQTVNKLCKKFIRIDFLIVTIVFIQCAT